MKYVFGTQPKAADIQRRKYDEKIVGQNGWTLSSEGKEKEPHKMACVARFSLY